MALFLPVIQAACSDDDATPTPVVLDAGGLDAPNSDSAVDAAVLDTGTIPDTSVTDAGSDAPTFDASDAADASLGIGLYTHGAGSLYRIDPNDAGVTLVGSTGVADVRLIWDEGAQTLRGIAKALTAPTLVTLDRCTGAATLGARLTKRTDAGTDGGLLVRGECWARHPDGTYYGGADWNGDPSNTPLSESLVKLDIDSGAVGRIAFPFKTTQADCDSATFVGTDFYALDVNGTTTTGLYRIDLTDASDTKIGSPPFDVVRVGYDESRQTLYGLGLTKTLYSINVGDAAAAAIGVMASDAALYDSVAAAPIPTCSP